MESRVLGTVMYREPKIMVFLYALINIIILSPPLYCRASFRIIMLFAMMLWIGIALCRAEFRISYFTAFVLVYIFLSVIWSKFGYGNFWNPRITKIYYFCFFAISAKRINMDKYESYEKVPWLILSILPVWLVMSIYHGLKTPMLFRSLSGSGLADNMAYSQMGVLGYDYIYAIVVCIPVILGVIFNNTWRLRNRFQKVLLVINIILNIIFLWIANYGIAIFTLIIEIIAFLIIGKRKLSSLKAVGLTLFSVVLFIVLFSNLSPLLNLLENLFDGTYYVIKIKSLNSALQSNETYGRIDIYINAFKEFLSNPILGNGFLYSINTHSEILYALVYYGIVTGGMEIAILFTPFGDKWFKRIVQERIYYSALIGFIIVMTFNPSGVALGPILTTLFRLLQIDDWNYSEGRYIDRKRLTITSQA